MNLAHPFGVARGQVIVYGNDVYAAPGQSVQISRQGRHQGLAFARAHLGNLALVQNQAADHLHIEMAHAGRAHARFTHQRRRPPAGSRSAPAARDTCDHLYRARL